MKTIITYKAFKHDFFKGLLILIIILGLMVITLLSVQGQTPYKLATGSLIRVTGTSNLHDWAMLASSFTCEANLKVKDGQLLEVNSLYFSLPVSHLKSKDKLMDTRSYKALKANAYKEITFKLINATIIPQQKIIKTTGSLSIGGVTQQVNLQTSYVLNQDESITCEGSQKIKMIDYKIKAPSYMMGALKTGDEVTISILLKLRKTDILSANK